MPRIPLIAKRVEVPDVPIAPSAAPLQDASMIRRRRPWRPSRAEVNLKAAFESKGCGEDCREECDRSVGPWKSTLMRCQPKPASNVESQEIEVQTDIHLAHCVKSITWLPMPDDIDPVREETESNCDEIDPMMLEDEAVLKVPDVNDVDTLEIADAGESGPECNPDPQIVITLMVMAIQAGLVHEIDGDAGENRIGMNQDFVGDFPEEDLENFQDVIGEFPEENLANFDSNLEGEDFELEDFDWEPETQEENIENFDLNLDGEDSELEDFDWEPEAEEESEEVDNSVEFEEESENQEVISSDKHQKYIIEFISIILMMSSISKMQETSQSAKEEFDVNAVGTEPSKTASSGTPVKPLLGIRKNKLKLKQGITMDSGSYHNVMPKRMVRRNRIRESEFSKKGIHYVAANKGKIPNEGETTFQFETLEGFDEEWDFQIAEVNKALASIADRVDKNCRVVFDKDEKTGIDASYIYNKTTKRVIKMTRVGNVWKVEAIVEARNVQMDSEAGFVRRG